MGRENLSASAVASHTSSQGLQGLSLWPAVSSARIRVLVPSLGQYASRDPIAARRPRSLYEVLDGSPAVNLDPEGLESTPPAAVALRPPLGTPWPPPAPNPNRTYGQHCGENWGVGGSLGGGGLITDQTDLCCFRHDQCWANNGDPNNTISKPCEERSAQQRACDLAICLCLRKARPSTPAELAANAAAQTVFCGCPLTPPLICGGFLCFASTGSFGLLR